MSDYLTEEEQVAAIKRWWSENGTSLLIGIVLIIGGVLAWRWYESNRQIEISGAAELYQSYLTELDKPAETRDADTLTSLLALIDAELPGTAYQTFSLFYRAKDSVEAEDYESAVDHLKNAVVSSSGSSLHDLALVRLAKVYQQSERQEDALTQLGLVKSKGYVAIAQELKGDIYRLNGEMTLAREAYQKAADLTENLSQRPLLEIKLNNTVSNDE